MYRIGIDVGSTWTKYCVMKDEAVESLSMEKTPVRQKEYFDKKIHELQSIYDGVEIVSCGYGKKNVAGIKVINELSALAKGCYFATGHDGITLDIGGQDTKIIYHEKGKLQRFFLNDKCAAGSGMFLMDTLDRLGMRFGDIDLTGVGAPAAKLSSVCAVFAQSEIVELIADNRAGGEIVRAVIWQILEKTKPLLSKIAYGPVLLTGGLSQIAGIAGFAELALGRECRAAKDGAYLAAVGCAMN